DEAAYAWLKKAIEGNRDWLPYEENNLRAAVAGYLYQQGRYAELADYLTAWVEKNPEDTTGYQQCLAALILADRVDRSEALLAQWLKEGAGPGELSPAATARLTGAIWLAFGQGYYIHFDRTDEKWLRPLAEVVLAIARSERDMSPANHIMGDWRYRATDE